MAFALAPRVDLKDLAQRFAETGRIHIPRVLAPDGAEGLHRFLDTQVEWLMAFNYQGTHRHTPVTAFEALPPAQSHAIVSALHDSARSGFQYFYKNYPVSDLAEAGATVYSLLADLHRFLNSDPVIAFVRAVTGFDDIAYCDAQATCFGPGHFLTQHMDDIKGKKRRVAYVLNLTKGWRPDWGGQLLFFDKAGNVTEGFSPSFNALNILAVPQPHAVGYVTPYAGNRYSITGWFRTA